jgi:hypothetical protein
VSTSKLPALAVEVVELLELSLPTIANVKIFKEMESYQTLTSLKLEFRTFYLLSRSIVAFVQIDIYHFSMANIIFIRKKLNSKDRVLIELFNCTNQNKYSKSIRRTCYFTMIFLSFGFNHQCIY